ncbi:hypothetical protein FGO68_gene877 [Halteria grandinella]|uniref:Uncharacterized protein n=1 Tax=Halteria grandinella TaxID=5974 RepID=A0A8J8SXP8_HALGN|nr:hypothetical protein FGO68_gene877 [Halteria grandinella]
MLSKNTLRSRIPTMQGTIPARSLKVNNKYKSLLDQFRDSWRTAKTNTKIVDYSEEKAKNYRGEFSEYARPFDRYLDENRLKEVSLKRQRDVEIAFLARQVINEPKKEKREEAQLHDENNREEGNAGRRT